MSNTQTISKRHRFESLVRGFLDKALGRVAGALLFLMMMVTFVDVVGRYVFNTPLPGGLEITEFMMGAIIFLGLPLVTADDGHIAVDLMDNLVPQFLKGAQAFMVNSLSMVVMGVITWKLWGRAVETADYGDNTAYLQIPLAPLVYFMCIMSGLTTIVFLMLVLVPKKWGQEINDI